MSCGVGGKGAPNSELLTFLRRRTACLPGKITCSAKWRAERAGWARRKLVANDHRATGRARRRSLRARRRVTGS